jgi:hypothetical protein
VSLQAAARAAAPFFEQVVFPRPEPSKHPLAPFEILLLARLAGERLVLKILPFLRVDIEMREFSESATYGPVWWVLPRTRRSTSQQSVPEMISKLVAG